MDTETKLDQILRIVTIVQQDVVELKERVTKLEERMTALEKRMTVLEKRMTVLEERITSLEERMTGLEERVTSLERSVFLIETQHGDKINALFVEREANEDAHKRIENAIENLKSEIQGTLFSHEKRISKLEGNLVPNF